MSCARKYRSGCRCQDCRAEHAAYMREYMRSRRAKPAVDPEEDFESMRDLLTELFPDGLTDDCPRQARAA